jgi:predicted  nucleic acid-binding Zn-ribbon protein
MPDGNGDYDWRERMRRLEDSVERKWADHERIRASQELFDRNMQKLHSHLVEQKKNIDNLVAAIRDLLDRIPPENLR